MKDFSRKLQEEIQGMDSYNGGVSYNTGKADTYKETASFAITATRLTANLDVNLPYCLFGAVFVPTNFQPLITLPSGITMIADVGSVVSQDAADQLKVQLTFTDGIDTDIVEITSKASAPYPALLEASKTDLFDVAKMRLSINSASNVDQFNTDLSVKSQSLFGKISEQTLDIASSKSPDQFQSTIVDVDAEFRVNKETGVLGELIQTAGVSVTHSLSISRFSKRV
jgi:hypothetical protein